MPVGLPRLRHRQPDLPAMRTLCRVLSGKGAGLPAIAIARGVPRAVRQIPIAPRPPVAEKSRTSLVKKQQAAGTGPPASNPHGMRPRATASSTPAPLTAASATARTSAGYEPMIMGHDADWFQTGMTSTRAPPPSDMRVMAPAVCRVNRSPMPTEYCPASIDRYFTNCFQRSLRAPVNPCPPQYGTEQR